MNEIGGENDPPMKRSLEHSLNVPHPKRPIEGANRESETTSLPLTAAMIPEATVSDSANLDNIDTGHAYLNSYSNDNVLGYFRQDDAETESNYSSDINQMDCLRIASNQVTPKELDNPFDQVLEESRPYMARHQNDWLKDSNSNENLLNLHSGWDGTPSDSVWNSAPDRESDGWPLHVKSNQSPPDSPGPIVSPLAGDSKRAMSPNSDLGSPERSRSPFFKSMYNQDGEEDTRAEPGVCGLSNLGNTCFMNAGLQCLNGIPQFVEYFTQGNYKHEINYDNPLGMQGRMANVYANLVRRMWAGKYSRVSPDDFKRTIADFAPQFSGYSQHDSQEFIAFLLDALHEDLNRVLKKPYVESVEAGPNDNDEKVAAEAWERHLMRNRSIVVDLFQGQLKSTVLCSACGHKSITFDPFMYLTVPIPGAGKRSLHFTFFPLNPSVPLLKYKAVVPAEGTVKDFRDIASLLTDIEPKRLVICEIFSEKIYQIFHDDDKLWSEHDDIVVFEAIEDTQATDVSYAEASVSHSSPGNGYSPTVSPLPALVSDERSEGISMSPVSESLSVPSNGASLNLDGSTLGKPHSPRPFVVKTGPTFLRIKAAERSFLNFLLPYHPNHQITSRDLIDFVCENILPRYDLTDVDRSTVVLQGESLDVEYCDSPLTAVSAKTTFNLTVPADLEHTLPTIETHASAKPSEEKKQLDLDQLFEAYTTCETLSTEDLYYCSNCKCLRQISKHVELYRLPDILIVHLKRFHYTESFRNKIDLLINFPLHNLDMSNYLAPSARPYHEDSSARISSQSTSNKEGALEKSFPEALYDLFAVDNHSGSMRFGHYTSYVKHPITGAWLDCNDGSVTKVVDEDQVVTDQAYLLFYMRKSCASRRYMADSLKTANETDAAPAPHAVDDAWPSTMNTEALSSGMELRERAGQSITPNSTFGATSGSVCLRNDGDSSSSSMDSVLGNRDSESDHKEY